MDVCRAVVQVSELRHVRQGSSALTVFDLSLQRGTCSDGINCAREGIVFVPQVTVIQVASSASTSSRRLLWCSSAPSRSVLSSVDISWCCGTPPTFSSRGILAWLALDSLELPANARTGQYLKMSHWRRAIEWPLSGLQSACTAISLRSLCRHSF